MMKSAKYQWLGAFALCAFAELLGEITGDAQFVFIFKPMLMPLLGIWFWLDTPDADPRLRYGFLLALVFACAGDTLLLFSNGPQGGLYFLLGLGAFLLMQIAYILFFTRQVSLFKGYFKQKPVYVLAFLAYLAGFLFLLWPGIPAPMRAPVVVYACTLLTMAISAINTKSVLAPDASLMALYGSLLFVGSDSILAINKFAWTIPDANIAIMITYIAGQWLLASGAAVFLKK